jgi:hypothetical protein
MSRRKPPTVAELNQQAKAAGLEPTPENRRKVKPQAMAALDIKPKTLSPAEIRPRLKEFDREQQAKAALAPDMDVVEFRELWLDHIGANAAR